MPGERHASLKLRITNFFPGHYLRIWLNGTYQQFGSPGAVSGALFAQQLATQLIPARLAAGGQGATYSTAFQPGADAGEGYLTITATSFEPGQNFQPPVFQNPTSDPSSELERLPAIPPVLITPTVTLAMCFGAATGGITLAVNNGTTVPTGPYAYLWDDGTTARDRPLLPAGTYTVRVQDASPAYAVATVTVGQNPALAVVLNRVGNDLVPTVTGGVGPYTYLWDDGSTAATRPNVAGGVTYTLTVTDVWTCTRVATLYFALRRYWFSGNPILLALDAGPAYRADPSTKPGLRFACEVFVERDYLSGAFERVGQPLEQPADAQGRTTFQVQELLEPFVEYHLPAVRQNYVSRATPLFCRFYLRHYELTDAGPGPAVTLDDSYLVRGGPSAAEAVAGTWFSGYQGSRLPFLTWEPAAKKVLADQPEYLYWMVPRAAATELRYQLRLTYADGQTQTLRFSTTPGVQLFEVYCLPAGYEQLQLGNYDTAANPLRQWEAYVLDQDDVPASDRRTYVLDRRPTLARDYFHYANSLGGLNTLAVRQPGQRQLTTTTLSGNPVDFDPLVGDVRIDRRTGQPTLKCYTGPRSPAQLQADEDFLLSERVWRVVAGRYQPGTVKDGTLTTADGGETRHTLEFAFELPVERFYTPLL